MAIPPAVLILPPLVDDDASPVELIPRPPANKSEPVEELVDNVVELDVILPVNVLTPVTKKEEPTYNFFPIAAPPDVLMVPPLVEFDASTVEDKAIDPAINKDPVEGLLEEVVFKNVTNPENEPAPKIDKSVPTYNFFATAIPPDVVILPPEVDDVASVVKFMARPPDNNTDPVMELDDEVVFDDVNVPEINSFPEIDKSVPTYNFFETAIPPDVVILPPEVDDVASVVKFIARPPDNNTDPVMELDVEVVFDDVNVPEINSFPEIDKSVPMKTFLATDSPPAVVMDPPDDGDEAS